MKSVFLPSRRRRAAMMRRFHYLELCRLFVARHFKVALTRVQSPAIAQAVHEGLEIYFHQPDLYWVMENKLSRYVHIAQVHWSEWYSQCVSLPQVLLVKKMQESIAAHGAVLISNRRFSAPAIAAAEDQGVALVRVRPAFDIYQCHIPRASCLQALQKLEKKMPLYQAEVLPLHVPAYGRVFAYRKEKPMTSQQYEELCRHFIAEQLRLPLAEVLSVCFPSKERVYPEPGRSLRPYAHQIDLYWQTRAGSVVYVNIANAKWRGQGDKLHLHDVLLLEKVKLDVGAHKAVLITNNGFTANATRAALENGIGLLVVRPEVAQTDWHPTDREAIQTRIQKLVRAGQPLYSFAVEQKTYGAEVTPCEALGGMVAPASRQVWAAFGGPPNAAGAAPPAPPPPSGGGLGGYSTRQGPGTGFRRK